MTARVIVRVRRKPPAAPSLAGRVDDALRRPAKCPSRRTPHRARAEIAAKARRAGAVDDCASADGWRWRNGLS
jgi:hypothetical protein